MTTCSPDTDIYLVDIFQEKFNLDVCLSTKGSDLDKFDYVDKENLRRWLVSLQGLTSNERSVLTFIFERTVGFGKLIEDISIKQISEGVFKKSNFAPVTAGTNLSPKTILKCVRSLIKKSILFRKQKGRSGFKEPAYTYLINLRHGIKDNKLMLKDSDNNKNDKSKLDSWGEMENLRKPAALKESSTNKDVNTLTFTSREELPTGVSTSYLPECVASPQELYNSNKLNNEKTKTEPTARPGYEDTDLNQIPEEIDPDVNTSSVDKLNKIVNTTLGKTEEEFSKKLKKKKINVSEFEKLWIKNLNAKSDFYNRKAVGFSGKERGMSRTILNRLNQAGIPVVEFTEFCLQEWELVYNSKLFWLESKPGYPSVNFILKFLDKFLDAYLNHKEMSLLKTMTEEEQIRYYCLRKGHTVEVADRTAKKKSADKALIAEVREYSKTMLANYEKLKNQSASLSSFLMKAKKQLKEAKDEYISGTISEKEFKEKSAAINIDEITKEIESFKMPEYSLETFESNFTKEELKQMKGLN